MMKQGIYWESNKPLAERVADAVIYFEKKYGRKPTAARVNPALLGQATIIEGVEVEPMRQIALNILWIGVQEAARGIEQASQDLLKAAA